MKKFLLILFILLSCGFIFLVYSGIFAKITVNERDIGPYTLVYAEHTGDYSQWSKVHCRVHGTLQKEFSINPGKCFGIYYDDPVKVAKEKLRSEIGCVLESVDAKKIESIKAKLKIKEYQKKKSIVVEFPLKSPLSPFIGIFKAYPALIKHAKQKGYMLAPALELYDGDAHKILYTFPIGK